MLGIDSDIFDIAHPKPNEGEESASTFPHAFFPAIIAKHLCKLPVSLSVLLLFFYDPIEVVFPVEHQAECGFAISLPLCLLHSLAQAKLSASPLLYFRVICSRYRCKHFAAELGNTEVCIRAKQLCEIALAFVGIGLKGLQSGMEQVDHEGMIAHRYFFLALEEF